MKARLVILLLLFPVALAASGQGQVRQWPPQLDEARRLFEGGKYEEAVPLLDQVIAEAQGRPATDTDAAAIQVAALELRARARFNAGDRAAAREDLRTLLMGKPTYTFSVSVTPRLTALLDEVRKATVGTVALTLDPPDARIEVDGVPVDLAPGGALALGAGPHRLVARKPGYKPLEQEIAVVASVSTPLSLALERVSAVIIVFTSPSGVDVSLDGKPAGTTQPGPPPARYHEWLVKGGFEPAKISAPLEIADVGTGSHVVAYSRPCHIPEDFRVDVPSPGDYRLDPTVVKPSVGTIQVPGGTGGGTVFLDGASKGTTPVVLRDVCSGTHTVEVRSSVGRLLKRVELKPNDDVTVEGTVRPAIALTSVSGGRGTVSAADVLAAVERLYAESRSATVFAPPREAATRLMSDLRINEGWLAGATAAAGEGTDTLAEAARREAGLRFAQAFQAQAVAEVVFAPREGGTALVLQLLAAGSGRPDSVDVSLENAARSVSALDQQAPRLLRPALGVAVADVLDVDGVVVVGVDAAGTPAPALGPGDVLTTVDGKKLPSGAVLERALEGLRAGSRVKLGVRDKAGATRQIELPVVMQPRLLAVDDHGIAWNKTVIDLRAALESLTDPLEMSVARANLGVALMGVGNWAEARDLLAGVRLPGDRGVGRGTILYLQGLCAEALSDSAGAVAAFRAAAAVPGALLTEDGPLIALLAAEAEARLGARPRRSLSEFQLPVPGA